MVQLGDVRPTAHVVMNIHIDSDEYNKRQMQLLEYLVREIISTLEEEGVSPDRLRKTVDSLAFRICTILDSSRIIDVEGKRLRPFLVFADDKRFEELVANEDGSSLHDEVYQLIEKIFKSKSSA